MLARASRGRPGEKTVTRLDSMEQMADVERHRRAGIGEDGKFIDAARCASMGTMRRLLVFAHAKPAMVEVAANDRACSCRPRKCAGGACRHSLYSRSGCRAQLTDRWSAHRQRVWASYRIHVILASRGLVGDCKRCTLPVLSIAYITSLVSQPHFLFSPTVSLCPATT